MGLFSRFERRMEDTLEGVADQFSNAPVSPAAITKKCEKKMHADRMVGANKQYAPTLYTVLINPQDDRQMMGLYPTLSAELESILCARAAEMGLTMDGQPLVRFIADNALRAGKFDVIAETVAAPIVEQLRDDELARYGISRGRYEANLTQRKNMAQADAREARRQELLERSAARNGRRYSRPEPEPAPEPDYGYDEAETDDGYGYDDFGYENAAPAVPAYEAPAPAPARGGKAGGPVNPFKRQKEERAAAAAAAAARLEAKGMMGAAAAPVAPAPMPAPASAPAAQGFGAFDDFALDEDDAFAGFGESAAVAPVAPAAPAAPVAPAPAPAPAPVSAPAAQPYGYDAALAEGKRPLPYVPEEEIDRSINYGEYTFNSINFADYRQAEPETQAQLAAAAAAESQAHAQARAAAQIQAAAYEQQQAQAARAEAAARAAAQAEADAVRAAQERAAAAAAALQAQNRNAAANQAAALATSEAEARMTAAKAEIRERLYSPTRAEQDAASAAQAAQAKALEAQAAAEAAAAQYRAAQERAQLLRATQAAQAKAAQERAAERAAAQAALAGRAGQAVSFTPAGAIAPGAAAMPAAVVPGADRHIQQPQAPTAVFAGGEPELPQTMLYGQQPKPAPRYRLRNLQDGRSYTLTGSQLFIGREAGCTIVVNDPNASRRHAEIRNNGKGVWQIIDLRSTNGTYLNGNPITSAVLADGDRITVGTTDLVFKVC